MSSMFSIIRNVISVFMVGLMCHLIVVNGNNEFELRLIPRLGSSLSGEGRVEVFQRGEDKGVWGNICDQGWDEKDAIVACRQLGFGNVGFPLNGQSTNSQYGNGDGEYLYSQFNCNGSENALRDCPYKTYSTDMGCSEMQAAGLMCFSDLDVRLISDTSGNTEGRLELFYKGDWSNVRIDDFDGKSANVACKQVRGDVKSAVGIIVDALRYGEDEGNCQFSNFKCKGNESYIRECDYTRSSTRESCVKLVAIKCGKEDSIIITSQFSCCLSSLSSSSNSNSNKTLLQSNIVIG
ncbi:neurotrypsin-like [Anneissia japonica]|uniref:neurotrypsin-like n=1 Tax=Anneissia japonica TaxID=1529436 RepID=UPI0014258D74|nr:neurotrypsin-like [Anneissia japonica]